LGEDVLLDQEQQQQMQYNGYFQENGMAPPEQLDFPMPGN